MAKGKKTSRKEKKTVNKRPRDSKGRFQSIEVIQRDIEEKYGLDYEFYKGFLKEYYNIGTNIKGETANKFVWRKIKESSEVLNASETFDFEDRQLIDIIHKTDSKIFINDIEVEKSDAVKQILSYTQSLQVGLAYFYIRTKTSKNKIEFYLTDQIRDEMISDAKKNGESSGTYKDKKGNYCLVSTKAKDVSKK